MLEEKNNLRENKNIGEKKEKRYDAGTFQNSIRNRYKNRKQNKSKIEERL